MRTATHEGPDAELRAGMISTQLLAIALSRYVLRLPPVAALEAETLIEMVTPVLDQFLTGPVPTRQQASS